MPSAPTVVVTTGTPWHSASTVLNFTPAPWSTGHQRDRRSGVLRVEVVDEPGQLDPAVVGRARRLARGARR